MEKIFVVCFVPPGEQGEIEAALHISKFHPKFVNTLNELIELLDQGNHPIVLFEEGFCDLSWQQVYKICKEHEQKPQLLVAHLLADPHMWVNVLEHGADLVVKPYEPKAVEHLLQTAFIEWGKVNGAS